MTAPTEQQLVLAQQAVDRWLASLSSANTRSAYRIDLATYLRWCSANGASPLTPDADVAERFRTDPALPPGTAAVARRCAALNGFLKHLVATNDANGVPDAGTERVAAPVARAATSSTVGLEPDDRRALLRSMDRHSSATQVLVTLLLLEGLKLDEALRLDAGDVRAATGERSMRIRLDRIPPRDHDVHPTTAGVLTTHLDGRRRGPLLLSASRRERAGSRLSRHGADYLIRQAGTRIGLPAPLTSNVLRRTHAAHAHAGGEAIDEIARRMGHDDVRSTRRYLDVSATMSDQRSTTSGIPIPHPTTAADGAGSPRRPISQEV